ncbi:MAG: hypothetical protein EOP43_05620 [Sphingobacteriaceae bacterium]|nr:MAG: hypothetical protein EOP43_05620 [Sphingobacteriaceae bacterium]
MNTLERTLSIINVSFKDNSTMILDLSNKRSVYIPLNEFPVIAALTSEERGDFEIIDDEYLSFLEIDEIYSLKELIG